MTAGCLRPEDQDSRSAHPFSYPPRSAWGEAHPDSTRPWQLAFSMVILAVVEEERNTG